MMDLQKCEGRIVENRGDFKDFINNFIKSCEKWNLFIILQVQTASQKPRSGD